MRRALLTAVIAALLSGSPAFADDDARATATCGHGARAELRIRADNGSISIEFTLRRRRAGESWRLVVAHERRVAWRGTVRTRGSSGSGRVRHSVRDLDGPDQVTTRAAGPHGLTCVATASLPG
jgi:hypothetical protein